MLAQILLAALAPAQDPVPELAVLRPGEVLRGEVADGAPVVSTETLAAGARTWEPVGRAIRIRIDEAGPHYIDLRSDYFDTYLVLRNEQGDVVAEDDDGLLA